MADSAPTGKTPSPILNDIQITEDRLTGRGGLPLFSRYLRNIEVLGSLEALFGSIRKSGKGLPVATLFKQVFCFLLDGTSRHLTYFDALAEDAGYAGAIETAPERMASSHQVKRFFHAFSGVRAWLFRRLLQRLFLWRLRIAGPEVVVLGLDTMIMDNGEAEVRHGVEPTYKRGVRGFQPLQITWGRYIVDAVFRGGSKHSNSGRTALRAIEHLVDRIRADYRRDVPIIFRSDSGFLDQEIFKLCEARGVGYICTGKLYKDLTARVERIPAFAWRRYEGTEQAWEYLALFDRRGSWGRSRRVLYTRPEYEEDQRLMEFARPDTVLYTNLGSGRKIDARLRAAGQEQWLQPERILECHHGRGRDELVHRALKEFAAEQLPFRRFGPNAAFYYTMLTAFFLYEAFKEDVTDPVVPVPSYPTRLRRTVLDIAAKIVRHAGQTVLKVTRSVWTQLQLAELWKRTADPPRFVWA